MTSTNQQVKLLMKAKKRYPLATAAAKAGMCRKTARKYLHAQKMPTELKQPRRYATRPDPFAAHWPVLEAMLHQAPELQAKTLLQYLLAHSPDQYHAGQLRTLQRRVQAFRAEHGADKAVVFRQAIPPGQSSQSDWTHMAALGITLAGQPFPHLLYHFMLPYSGWEAVTVCATESFTTLTQGYEQAVWALGGTLPSHRTDNLSAATRQAGGQRVFTERWQAFLQHYQVQPTRNNPGQSHENGSVEKSHDTFKRAVDQHLLLRGSRDFADQASYAAFLQRLTAQRNQARHARLQVELPHLQPLPERKWHDPVSLWVRVSPFSTLQVLGCTYSVPSRLIHFTLRADVYPEHITLSYGQKALLTLPRLPHGHAIDYRHIIDSLVRKPGAFAHYQYRESLFPHPLFRWAYDTLSQAGASKATKAYLQVLQYAKLYGEAPVVAALQLCQDTHQRPEPEVIKKLVVNPLPARRSLTLHPPSLAAYDQLHVFGQEVSVC